MTRKRPQPTAESLPAVLPIFPLPGVLLLPGGQLPLHIFEPRYLAMVDDALSNGSGPGSRMIGMIQPLETGTCRRRAATYATGCAGRITRFNEVDDGRYHITLTGVCRFRVGEELPQTPEAGLTTLPASGAGDALYRQVIPVWDAFLHDLKPVHDCGLDRPRLLAGLRAYFRNQNLTVDWQAVENTPDERLVTSLAMICPFGPCEKQALLEAPDATERARLLVALVEMALREPPCGCDAENPENADVIAFGRSAPAKPVRH